MLQKHGNNVELALEELKLDFNPASQQAKKDVKDALSARQ